MDLIPLTPPSDKREATKWHNRRAIVDAAAELSAEQGFDGFTVSDLAQRAGVSRRTIFNHFATVDDAVFAVFADRITGLYEQFERELGERRFDSLPEAFGAFAQTLVSIDVLGRIQGMIAPLGLGRTAPAGGGSEPVSTGEVWAGRITDAVARECAGSLQRRSDSVDPFETRLLVELVVTALSQCVDHWMVSTDQSLSPASRAEFDRLLEIALGRLQRGFST